MKRKLLSLVLASAVYATVAQEVTPVWELGKNPIPKEMITGSIELKDGIVEVDAENTFALPSSIVENQQNYTIEFELKRPEKATGISVVSNADKENNSGFQLFYFPPTYNATWVMINGSRALENRNFSKGGFNKITIVIQDGQLMFFRDGLILGMTSKVTPSAKDIIFGGASQSPQNTPEKYALKNIKIYNQAITPTGFDPSIERMRSYSGPGYTVDRVDVTDPSLPRILVIGDSISMGYRPFITKHYKGKAYVDYWVGGAWVNGPYSVIGKDSAVKKAWRGVLGLGPYDVITWNPMGLHMLNPKHDSRTPMAKAQQIITEVVENIQESKDAKTTIIWLNTTPFCKKSENSEKYEIDTVQSDKIIKFNAIADEVMKKHNIPQIDMWKFSEQNIDKVSRDGVHWSKEASEMMAKMIISEIDKHLPKK